MMPGVYPVGNGGRDGSGLNKFGGPGGNKGPTCVDRLIWSLQSMANNDVDAIRNVLSVSVHQHRLRLPGLTKAVASLHSPLQPDIKLVNAAMPNQPADVALALYRWAVTRGLKPDGHTYSSVITSLAREGRAAESAELFLRMLRSGLPLDQHVVCSIITALRSHWHAAQHVFLSCLDVGFDLPDKLSQADAGPGQGGERDGVPGRGGDFEPTRPSEKPYSNLDQGSRMVGSAMPPPPPAPPQETLEGFPGGLFPGMTGRGGGGPARQTSEDDPWVSANPMPWMHPLAGAETSPQKPPGDPSQDAGSILDSPTRTPTTFHQSYHGWGPWSWAIASPPATAQIGFHPDAASGSAAPTAAGGSEHGTADILCEDDRIAELVRNVVPLVAALRRRSNKPPPNPNVMCANAQLAAYAKGGQAQRSAVLLRWMLDSSVRRPEVQPDSISFNTCITTLLKAGVFETGLEFFECMLTMGVQPNSTTSALVTSGISRGLINPASHPWALSASRGPNNGSAGDPGMHHVNSEQWSPARSSLGAVGTPQRTGSLDTPPRGAAVYPVTPKRPFTPRASHPPTPNGAGGAEAAAWQRSYQGITPHSLVSSFSTGADGRSWGNWEQEGSHHGLGPLTLSGPIGHAPQGLHEYWQPLTYHDSLNPHTPGAAQQRTSPPAQQGGGEFGGDVFGVYGEDPRPSGKCVWE
ncbi:unnamed protein product [Pedinophyceae sp. YPF-701]|nr:unnamed protein product [Pedinophyceae sp. YPF-701]